MQFIVPEKYGGTIITNSMEAAEVFGVKLVPNLIHILPSVYPSIWFKKQRPGLGEVLMYRMKISHSLQVNRRPLPFFKIYHLVRSIQRVPPHRRSAYNTNAQHAAPAGLRKYRSNTACSFTGPWSGVLRYGEGI